MTLQEATDVLAKHQPVYRVNPPETKGVIGLPGVTYLPLLSATLVKNGGNVEGITAYFSQPPLPSRVVGVVRSISPLPEDRPTVDNLDASLRDKFGDVPPVRGDASFSWVWSKEGSPMPTTASRQCANETTWTEAVRWDANVSNMQPMLEALPCGAAGFASYQATNSIVQFMKASIWDANAIVAARAKTVAAIAAASQQQQNDALTRAKSNKPAL